jgi:hypothetical protein
MAKKADKVNGLGLILALVLIACAVIAVILPAGAGVKYTYKGVLSGTSTGSIKGFDLIFGAKDSNGNTTVDMVPGLLSAWLLVILGGVAGILGLLNSMFGSQKALSKYVMAFGGLLAFVGGILFFCAVPLANLSNSSLSYSGTSLASMSYSLGAGFLFSGILACVGGVAGIADVVVK